MRRRALCLALGAALCLPAQTLNQPGRLNPDWRRIGSHVFESPFGWPATGAVERVWFNEDGSRIFANTGSGRTFESAAEQEWAWRRQSQPLAPPDIREWEWLASAVPVLPEPGAKVRAADPFFARLYAFGSQVYRSDDGGRSWRDLTGFRGESIIGSGFRDLAVSPLNPDLVVVANQFGVWLSNDGGLCWMGLNENLPNLPVQRILGPPSGTGGIRVRLVSEQDLEWPPGEKSVWRRLPGNEIDQREIVRRAAAAQISGEITTVELRATMAFAGTQNGEIWISFDEGRSWQLSRRGDGQPVTAISALPRDPRVVFVGLSRPPGGKGPLLLSSLDGGVNWNDLSDGLPEAEVRGLAPDPMGAAIYLATNGGIFMRLLDPPLTPGMPVWMDLSGNLPEASAVDVALDEAGYQVYAALEGYGVYAAPAPHRYLSVTVVNAADFSRRPAAPGSLLSVLGGRLLRARAGLAEAPILHATESEAQIQIPFTVTGSAAQLALELSRGQVALSIPLLEVSPAIFVDADGTPLIFDATSGLPVDSENPARAGGRLHILATGLGKVRPEWPAGMAAPAQNPPQVIAEVRAYLDQTPIQVTRATLAPGFTGFYLVEIQLPALLNPGPAALFLEASGRASNVVRIDLEY